MGVSSSYRQAWRFFEMASESSSNVDALVKGPIMCAFDNLNITKHRSHLRKDCRLEMWDMATRLVISADIDPEVTIPRRDITRRAQIDESSILPSPEDSISVISGHEEILSTISAIQKTHCTHRDAFANILDVNEGTTNGTITVLKQFAKDLSKGDSSPVAIDCR
eukprot:m.190533 g.190533  ORF g.190533 m.190533 type:complete len:165 (+) comp39433_c1_seq30:741-1235(+)